ncbi:alpha-hydroxy-acid oxidizing protein [Rhodovulum sp. 12E13]|uniref:alpha-hydroxy acid oxidase n=1 Tax=Rhodovulum sp. 12E13 TaxID=2203891 RepID=UPI000E17F865|nr:alpha-hydroxy acid oxidase [Rhodovulum sp. 12E13]RDC73203.1 alpha-hydroxy-acid oxidizing protein [Rhodovulum sp. 12E13]
MSLDQTHPAIPDLARTARRRIPHFAWEYLHSAVGDETARDGAEAALDAVRLVPRALRAVTQPDLSARLMGRDYPLPFGLAPVGMSGLVWPGAEETLARLAAREGVPYTLSTVSASTPEKVGRRVGEQGWFQLYPPGQPEIRDDLCRRAREAGFHTLVLTADVPAPSRRERLRRARLSNPMRLTPRTVLDAARRPRWALGQLARGIPSLETLAPYAQTAQARGSTEHVGYLLRCAPDIDYLRALREAWEGPLVVKGILHPDDARAAVEAGADAIWVSNHGGRQFDGGPAPIRQLPLIRAALGPEVPVIYDSGIRSGLDILRARALGADFVMVGRAVHYGLAAFGAEGAAHAVHVLREQMLADLCQLGCARLADLPGHLAEAGR